MFGNKDIWAAVSFKNCMTEQGLSQWEEWLHIGTKDQYTLDILNALHSIWWGGGAGIEHYYWLAQSKKTELDHIKCFSFAHSLIMMSS